MKRKATHASGIHGTPPRGCILSQAAAALGMPAATQEDAAAVYAVFRRAYAGARRLSRATARVRRAQMLLRRAATIPNAALSDVMIEARRYGVTEREVLMCRAKGIDLGAYAARRLARRKAR